MKIIPSDSVYPNISDCEQTDSQMIQDAVNLASNKGVSSVVIPAVNPRSGKCLYEIDEAILLPSDITVYLENCYMVLKDGICDNIFRNENMYSEVFGLENSEQRNISIIGVGHPVLDGAGHNDVFEWSSLKDGYKHVSANNLIIFHNVDGFEIKNIEVRNQRWWALNFIYCSNGHICDITSRTDALFSNQDGINLRYGCHHVTIERISGNSGDDFIALSAIGGNKRYQQSVEGKERDIHDIVVRDIIGTSAHEGIVTLRCHDGSNMYNILVENIIESNYDNENLLPYGTILIGQNYFYGNKVGDYGSMRNLTLRNIHTKSGGTCITLGNTLIDSKIENLDVGGCVNAVTTTNYDHRGLVELSKRSYGKNGIKLSNVKIDGVHIRGDIIGTPIELAQMRDDDFIENLVITNVVGYDTEKLLDYCRNGKSKIVVESKEYV